MCTPTLCTVKDNAHVYMCTSTFLGFWKQAVKGWKCTYTHVHCLCDCVTQRRGIFSLVRLLDTGTRPLTLLGCFELLLLYFPRCLFTHSCTIGQYVQSQTAAHFQATLCKKKSHTPWPCCFILGLFGFCVCVILFFCVILVLYLWKFCFMFLNYL